MLRGNRQPNETAKYHRTLPFDDSLSSSMQLPRQHHTLVDSAARLYSHDIQKFQRLFGLVLDMAWPRHGLNGSRK